MIDSHLWIDYFSGTSGGHTDEVDRLLDTDTARMVGPIFYELLVGPKREDERRYLLGRLRELPLLETSESVWMKAVELGRIPSVRKSDDFPLSDIFIAAHCIIHQCALFTRDHHFDVFGELRRHRP